MLCSRRTSGPIEDLTMQNLLTAVDPYCAEWWLKYGGGDSRPPIAFDKCWTDSNWVSRPVSSAALALPAHPVRPARALRRRYRSDIPLKPHQYTLYPVTGTVEFLRMEFVKDSQFSHGSDSLYSAQYAWALLISRCWVALLPAVSRISRSANSAKYTRYPGPKCNRSAMTPRPTGLQIASNCELRFAGEG